MKTLLIRYGEKSGGLSSTIKIRCDTFSLSDGNLQCHDKKGQLCGFVRNVETAQWGDPQALTW